MKKRTMILIGSLTIAALMLFSSCAALDAWFNNTKGQLVGQSFNMEFYDNYGSYLMAAQGNSVSIEGITTKSKIITSEGVGTVSELSSVLDITIDGSKIYQTGSTFIAEESGLQREATFSLPSQIISEDAGFHFMPYDKFIADIHNYIGAPRVIFVMSQLGEPICAYSGTNVFIEVPSDLPKMTRLTIDGKSLYLHRVNYIIVDLALF